MNQLALTKPTGAAPAAPWQIMPAAQQPRWQQHPDRMRVMEELADAPALVRAADVVSLRHRLAAVAAGDSILLQIGDCVEPIDECTAEHVSAKLRALDRIAGQLRARWRLPVVRVARIAGQYAKPRSAAMELVDSVSLPVFRGHLVNSEMPTRQARRHDPTRMLTGYTAAARAHRWLEAAAGTDPMDDVWSSHEALVLDYEQALLRENPDTGTRYLASTHFPWIGNRTRQVQGAHVALAAAVENPIACKIGPTARPDTVVGLCRRLDPDRSPGRLTLIARMGHRRISTTLPDIVAAVRHAGHPVIWVCDPMHGNTVQTQTGRKVRHLSDLAAETIAFQHLLARQGVRSAGLHLEVAADDVTECLGGNVLDEQTLDLNFTSLCDPRLNVDQALALIDMVAS